VKGGGGGKRKRLVERCYQIIPAKAVLIGSGTLREKGETDITE